MERARWKPTPIGRKFSPWLPENRSDSPRRAETTRARLGIRVATNKVILPFAGPGSRRADCWKRLRFSTRKSIRGKPYPRPATGTQGKSKSCSERDYNERRPKKKPPGDQGPIRELLPRPAEPHTVAISAPPGRCWLKTHAFQIIRPLSWTDYEERKLWELARL